MTQLNTPYPATAYLAGYLRNAHPELLVQQKDGSLDLFLKLFSKTSFEKMAQQLTARNVKASKTKLSSLAQFFLQHKDSYIQKIEPTLRFLQGRDASLGLRIASRQFLPEGPRFASLDEEQLFQAYGSLAIADRAKYLASLFVDDCADLIRENIDELFSLSRYGEKLAASIASFDLIENKLTQPSPTLVDQCLTAITLEYLQEAPYDLVAITAPFPGNVLGAFAMAQTIKKFNPQIKTVLGGGYVNTELRKLQDPRVFNYFDFITYDDGERPLSNIIGYLTKQKSFNQLVRTRTLQNQQVIYQNNINEKEISFKNTGTPTYQGLNLNNYLSLVEMLNPMHRLWSDARWNKLTVAHGCYWKKCSFCDVTLDYIQRYEPIAAQLTVARMTELAQETGQSGFHFVDEAAPPKLLNEIAQEIIKQKKYFSWWGNIRFEKTFSSELTQRLAAAGCIAVTGGLEVASNRLLKMMNKGVSVEQVAQVTRNFREAGILVHAYLMYGFPTESTQETIDSLEMVRQLFLNDCLQSAYWHRFSATVHSPIGKNPQAFNIKLKPTKKISFAENDLAYQEKTLARQKPANHDWLGVGLKKAVYNFMHGVGLDQDVRVWFDGKVPATSVAPDFIERALK